MRRVLTSLAVLLLLAGAAAAPAPAGASDIRFVVNGAPVTSYDIQRRAAFLKLQHRGGDVNKTAATEMVDQALRSAEVKRLNISIADQTVDDAYARFAKSNKMTLAQLDGLLDKAGVTKSHFKEYIRAQMGWNQALSARFNFKSGRLSQRDAVQQMFKEKGAKPSAIEYMLQQVIFVVPAAERGASMGKRRAEAESMRQRFSSCEKTRQFAKGLIDVTVRDLGRTLEPALPKDWAEAVKAARSGGATPVRDTERGVEFIGICSTREVSDDRVSQMLAQTDAAATKGKGEELSTQYVAELRKRAKIVER